MMDTGFIGMDQDVFSVPICRFALKRIECHRRRATAGKSEDMGAHMPAVLENTMVSSVITAVYKLSHETALSTCDSGHTRGG